jgi:phosphoribosylaminoimidazole carboxylase (NCAIR synthetase)
VKIKSLDEAEAALAKAGQQELILEAFVDFACELSVVAARGLNWRICALGRGRKCAQQSYP